MAVDLAELKVELNTDPNAYGYGTHIAQGAMQSVANLINQERSELPQTFRNIVLQAHILGETTESEYYALSPAQRQLFHNYTLVDLNMQQAPEMRAQIEGLFPPESATSGSVYNFQTKVWSKQSSRAEQLWGTGTIVTWQQCVDALALL